MKTGLVNPSDLSVPIKKSYSDGPNHLLSLIVDNKGITEDILMTEIGVYARIINAEGDEIMPEILYGYTYTNKYDFIPVADNYFIHREITFNTILSRNSNIEIIFDGSVTYVTTEDFEKWSTQFEQMLKAYVDGLIASLEARFNAHLADNLRHINYCATAGSANAYTACPAYEVTLSEGLAVLVKIHATNTGASTLDLCGKGAQPVADSMGNILLAGSLTAGCIYWLVYDGAKFMILSGGKPAYYI